MDFGRVFFMKKTLAAAVAFLMLVCFAGGCLRDDAALSTQVRTAAEQVTQTLAESVSETTAAPEKTTAEKTTAEKMTAEKTTAEKTTAEKTTAEKTTVEKTTTEKTTAEKTTAEKTTTEKTTAEKATTEKTTAEKTTTEKTTTEKTTRRSLIDQLRDLRNQYTEPKPDPAFFDDVVFVGDSVTQGLRGYVTGQRNKGKACLGSAQFLCCGSMSYTNALAKVGAGSMHPTYKGKKVTIEDGVKQCGAKKVFIMLGMNDFSAYSEKAWKQNVLTLLDRITEKNPDVSIYLESVTPIISGMEHGRFSNENIQEFNAYIQQVCDDRGYTYVDIYHVLADDTGHLKKSYCGDPSAMGIHMSGAGSAAWAQYLQTTFCGE